MKREVQKGKKEFDEQFSLERENRIRERVKERIKERDNPTFINYKLIYASCAAVLLFGLIVSLSFVSPSMASVISNIPFLNELMEKEDSIGVDSIGDLLIHELREDNFKVSQGTNIDFREKTIYVGVEGTKDYYQKYEKDIIERSNSILDAHGLGAYTVEVTNPQVEKEPYDDGITEEMQKKYDDYEKRSLALSDKIMSELNEQNYHVQSADVRINDKERFIPLEIPVSETRVDEIKEIVRKVAEEKEPGEFKIKVYTFDPIREEAQVRWSPVIDTLTEGLIGKSELKVELVGFTFYSDPYTLSVDTSIDKSNPNASMLANEIEDEMNTFINSKEIKKVVNGDEYQIIVKSKDGKKIN
ncbi:DUF4030 domain-containing protein [Alkalihalobacillus hwajinpoensis]|uniref:DUF4030 domain-containing protein n=1 Tax=Guptibacillus hwajinpoensis TaxID=208199 RepID=UPI001883EE6B|nr:DUF4030 domain-containing protein [Pseudalkalibacillus hwajinpoensis]MBF0705828.1 DUF4030 domain-containing protein [Pseudalkalibacillus hwajinpoensis]